MFLDVQGNKIKISSITGVRLGDRQKYTHGDGEHKPRVIVDFNGTNCVVANCESDAERDDLAGYYMAQINSYKPFFYAVQEFFRYCFIMKYRADNLLRSIRDKVTAINDHIRLNYH